MLAEVVAGLLAQLQQLLLEDILHHAHAAAATRAGLGRLLQRGDVAGTQVYGLNDGTFGHVLALAHPRCEG